MSDYVIMTLYCDYGDSNLVKLQFHYAYKFVHLCNQRCDKFQGNHEG